MLLLLLSACTADVAPDWLVEVTLSDDEVELEESVTATVTVTDADGEVVDAPYTLSTLPADGVSIDGDELTFVGDGLYTVVATIDEWSELTGEAGPVTADSNGPSIQLTSPERGEHFERQDEITVTGIVTDAATGVASLTLDGVALDVDANGEFSTTMSVGEGLELVWLEAVDNDGNTTDTIVGVLNGAYTPEDEAVDPGMDVYLTREGLDALTQTALADFDAETLEADLIASNPVLSDTVLFCIDYEGDLRTLEYGEVEATLGTTAFGLTVEMVIPDLYSEVDVTLDLCGASSTTDTVTATASVATVVTELSITVPTPGDVEVEVRSVDVTFEDLEVDYGSLEEAITDFGVSLADLGLDADTLAGLLFEQMLTSELPPPIEEALESIAIEEEIDMLGATATLEALISDVWTSSGGMNVYLQVDASVDAEADVPEAPGSLTLGGQASPDGSQPLAASIGADTLNRLMFAAWQGGVLNLEVSHEETGLDADTLGLLFEGAETMDLVMEPLLPPVVVAATGDGFFDLQLGELLIHASGLVDGVETELATWSVMATGDITVSIDETSGELAIVIDGLDVEVDEHVEDPNTGTDAEYRELLLGGVAASQIGSLLPDLTFALPELDGYVLTLVDVAVTGDDGTWMTAQGSLTVE